MPEEKIEVFPTTDAWEAAYDLAVAENPQAERDPLPFVGQEVAVLFPGLQPAPHQNSLFAFRAWVLAVRPTEVDLHVPRYAVSFSSNLAQHLVADDGWLPRFCTEPGPDVYEKATVPVERIYSLWADYEKLISATARKEKKTKAFRAATQLDSLHLALQAIYNLWEEEDFPQTEALAALNLGTLRPEVMIGILTASLRSTVPSREDFYRRCQDLLEKEFGPERTLKMIEGLK